MSLILSSTLQTVNNFIYSFVHSQHDVTELITKL
jgi:hypothetical protein